MKTLKLLHKFWLLISVLLLMMCLQIGTIIYDNNTIKAQFSQVTNQEIPLLNKAHQLKLAVIQVQQFLTDISATRGLDGLNDGYAEAENNAQLFKKLIAELQQLDPANKEQYTAMLPTFNKYYATGIRMAKSYVSQGPAGGNRMMTEFDEAASALAKQVDDFVTKAQSDATSISAKSLTTLSGSNSFAIEMSLVMLSVGFFVFALVMGAIKTIPPLNAALARVAKGDLNDDSLKLKRSDEIGELATSIGTMKRSLREMLHSIDGASTELHNAVSGYTSHSTDTLNCMTRQKDDLDQIASAMTEMSATAQEMVRSVETSSDATHQATQQAMDSAQMMQETNESINEVASEIQQAANAISDLSSQSQEIGSILDVIRGIADQTNLLALNAAIEAARAGEQGRGFSVVADEVRTLAQRTQESTEQIQHMIEKLQASTHFANELIQKDAERTLASNEKVGLASEKIAAVTRSISEIEAMTGQIASAATEQCAVTEEMSRNINNIYNGCEETTRDTEKMNGSSGALEKLANNLTLLVHRFNF
jgi:methyl-accepting chemotaxis protein